MTSPSLIELLLQAGFVVKFVLVVLLAGSILSWGIITQKHKQTRQADLQNQEFLNLFWNARSLDEIFPKSEALAGSPMASAFRAGHTELKKLGSHIDLQNIERALQKAINEHQHTLEKHLDWLATIASSAPFVGLFGTVWGIMNSFQGIGSAGSASLAVVAPGISEALVATAIGLSTAIPAALFFNLYNTRIRTLTLKTEGFCQDFLNLIQRSIHAKKGT